MMGLRSPQKPEVVRGYRRQHLHWGCMRLSGLQLTYSMGMKKMLKLKLTFMPVATYLDNTSVTGMTAEKHLQ